MGLHTLHDDLDNSVKICYNLGMVKTCPFCLKEFTPILYSLKEGYKKRYSTARFCSTSCMAKERYRRNHKYYEEYWRKDSFKWQTKRLCPICSKEFLPLRINQLQCSIRCTRKKWKKAHWRKVLDYANARLRSRARKDWKEKNCSFCNKLFLPDIRHKYAIYCCVNCRVKANYRKQIQTGRKKIYADNYRKNNKDKICKHDEEYKARIRFGATSKTLNKIIVLKRDSMICQVCKKPYEIIHHIRYSGKAEDLVCLCRSCHASIHQRIKTPPYLLP